MVSSSAFDAMLVCEPRRSPTLIRLVLAACGLTAAAALIYLPITSGAALAVAVALLAAFELRRLSALPVLYWSRDGAWRLGDPESEPLLLDGSTWSTSVIILLVLRGARGRTRVPLARDSLDAVTWRRLRARLHVAGAAATRLEQP